MKYLKLLAIVVITAAILFGAVALMHGGFDNIFTHTTKVSLLDKQKKAVDHDWDGATEWNKAVYEKNIADAKTYKKDLEKQAVGNYSTLVNYTNEKVCNKLISFLNAEFAKTNCDRSKINKIKGDIDVFVKINEDKTITNKDNRISKAYGKITLYNNILNFGSMQFYLSPGFNFSNSTWNDFDRYKAEKLKKRDDYKKSPYYSSLSRITAVNTAINSAESKLEKARNEFARNLSNQIIHEYGRVKPTSDNFNKFQNKVYNNFNFDDGGQLSSFRRRFKKEVEKIN